MNGRLVQIGLIGGSKVAIDLPRDPSEAADDHRLDAPRRHAGARRADRAAGSSARSGRCSSAGEVRPVVHAEFPLARAAERHRELESGRVIGKRSC